ncbi:hypothetical protein [Hymenobacter negativus]|uniref:Lipoprotein n=1 Tax=Hymenobacter negativus TaxID=2795026 RepID=A0ABS3QEJ1_9BACT|nr:hypothetical protein [Hymenobacter negativus]MBO2009665.1 hypothetical protein [Hymenobacter negativus]
MLDFRFSAIDTRLALSMAVLLSACSVSEQTAETAAPTAVPTEVRTDADRRAIYNSNGVPSSSGYAVPDATPNRVRLGEQAAGINNQKRIENVNTNDPNNTSPETRLQRLNYDAPLPDTTRRR